MPSRRYLLQSIVSDLQEKMVFLGGPRQVGKTTLAMHFLAGQKDRYFNWDDPEDRSRILTAQLPHSGPLLVLDEVHKYRNWRSLVKGIFDKHRAECRILVTGSARLDHFRKGGDSLVGRYHYYRLHPFSLPEMSPDLNPDHLKQLLAFGGFPEPLFKQNERHYRRWSKDRISRVVTQDLRDLENVKDVSLIELLTSMLPPRVGSLLSLHSLSEDLQVSPHTVERWLTILEYLYVCFRIAPYSGNRARALKKMQKCYLWDWALVPGDGARFENLVASHLLKYCHFEEDQEGYKMELRYIRDTQGREVDFVVLKDQKALFAVECKSGERSLSPSLAYFQERLSLPAVYQVHLGQRDYGNERRGGRVLPFAAFCRAIGLV